MEKEGDELLEEMAEKGIFDYEADPIQVRRVYRAVGETLYDALKGEGVLFK